MQLRKEILEVLQVSSQIVHSIQNDPKWSWLGATLGKLQEGQASLRSCAKPFMKRLLAEQPAEVCILRSYMIRQWRSPRKAHPV